MLVAGALIARVYLERDALAHALTFMNFWWPPIVVGVISLSVVLLGFDGYSKPVGFYSFMVPFASLQAEPLIHGVAAELSPIFGDGRVDQAAAVAG